MDGLLNLGQQRSFTPLDWAGLDDIGWVTDGLVVTAQPPQTVTGGVGFGLTVTAEDPDGQVDTVFNGPVTLSLGNDPGGGPLGGTLTATAVDGVATFSNLTIDQDGDGYTLLATSTSLPTVTTTTSPVDVTDSPVPTPTPTPTPTPSPTPSPTPAPTPTPAPAPTPTPAPPTSTPTPTPTPTPPPTPAPAPAVVSGQQPVFHRKTNKKGKPVGKPVLTGFTFDFSDPLDPSAAANPANYRVDAITSKKVKRTVEPILHPIANFSVTYAAASDAVTITFQGKETFPTGGQITVLGVVTTESGGPPGENLVFTIARGGGSVEPG
jgi:hypothetical protein